MRILLLAVLATTARAHLGGSHGSPDEERHSQFQDSNSGSAAAPPPMPATASVSLRTASSPAGGEAPTSSCPEICPFDYRPICGSDGITYTNECTFSKAACRNQALQQSYVGPCVPQLDLSTTDVDPGVAPTSLCSERCQRIFLPVCGSNGLTYNNPCILQFADCTSREAGGRGISVAREGSCEDRGLATQDQTPPIPDPTSGPVGETIAATASPCKQECTKTFLPVCGSDGNSYNNKCLLDLASCTSLQAGGNEIFVAAEGLCVPQDTHQPEGTGSVDVMDGGGGGSTLAPISACLTACNKNYLPVCGSDGNSYNNRCELGVASCESVQAGGGEISFVADGLCGVPQDTKGQDAVGVGETTPAPTSRCRQECPKIYLPVCGSDGNSYNNKCLLDLASCEGVQVGRNEITAVAEGLCGTQEPDPTVGPVVVGAGGATPAPASSCQTACTRDFLPVCGSDGNSYNNECLLVIASCESVRAGGGQISVVAEGFCAPPGTQEPDPTVGPDVVGAGDATPAPASSCQTACTRDFLPVCGSDGNSYNNECLLVIASCESVRAGGGQISVVSEGFCGTQGSEGRVPDAVVVAETTPAPTSRCRQECPKIYLPVCGSDGNSYNNKCLLDLASCEGVQVGRNEITAVSEGLCAPAVSSKPDVGAVTEEVGAKGTSSCRQECTKTFLPVCGSDGNTYDNECILNLASCRRRKEGGRGLYVVTTGPCDSQGVKDDGQYRSCRECSDAYDPVCGNDGRTYDNECILDNSNCKSWQVGKPGVYIVRDGPCGDYRPTAPPHLLAEASDTSPLLSSLGVSTRSSSCPDQCTQDYSPVCGTDNLTYDNKCVLLTASCRRRSLGGADITIAFHGPCVAALPRGPVCDTGCDKSMSPVCGSDGVMYGNPCLLSLADCLNPFASITRVSDGPCDSSEEDSDSRDVVLDRGVHGGYLPPV